MQLSENEFIGLIKDLLRNALDSLKNEDYQRKVWFRAEGEDVDSYDDTIVHLLTRCENIFAYPSSEDFLGKENYDLLKKLDSLAGKHLNSTQNRLGSADTDLLQEDELLNDPKWHDIQALATEVYNKLQEFVRGK